jgi:site-specific DNA-methyltransferase (adenine-specific)
VRVETIGNATLYLGDSMEILPSLRAIPDAVITDPPYGVGLSGKDAKQRDGSVIRGSVGYIGFDDTEEYVRSVVVPIIEQCAGLKRMAVTPGTRCLHLYPRAAEIGCFYSAAGTGMSSWGFTCSQPILYYGKCPFQERGLGCRANSMGQAYPNDANESGHPCAKPLAWMRWLVWRASWEGETVFDPFMGSGTTGVAAVQLGRSFVGVELVPQYFDIACERIENAQRQERLFA